MYARSLLPWPLLLLLYVAAPLFLLDAHAEKSQTRASPPEQLRTGWPEAAATVRHASSIRAGSAATHWTNVAQNSSTLQEEGISAGDAHKSTDIVGCDMSLDALHNKTRVEGDSLFDDVTRHFILTLKATYHRLPKKIVDSPWGANKSFTLAQTAANRISGNAGVALQQMAYRFREKAGMEALLRERQDLDRLKWRCETAISAADKEIGGSRNAAYKSDFEKQLSFIKRRLGEIDKELESGGVTLKYLDTGLSGSRSLAEVRRLLSRDEVLVQIFDTPSIDPFPEESFIWAISDSDYRWVRSDLGTKDLTRDVAALRCGLDYTAWRGGGEATCQTLLGTSYSLAAYKAGAPLPFDSARAHKLYKSLFGEIEDFIKGKHLLIVPSGPLQQLPFQVLVTRPPQDASPRSVGWLVQDHPITVLPTVASFESLRKIAKPSAAPLPMAGFGNPLLEGPSNAYAPLAKLARERQWCPDKRWQQVAAAPDLRGGPATLDMPNGLANVAQVRTQVPLPETADELCAVATDLKAEPTEIRLGDRATEHEIKAMNARGELARYRIIHFATHGVMAGQLGGASEPGLILTPPRTATKDDDGYLTASEIMELKLDADLVVLSACNTAAGGAGNREALSGVARAFFYAQARALLVSHWEVDSDTTVQLVTTLMRQLSTDPKIGRAEALRRSMKALIENGSSVEARPAYWAPFVIVGEGGAGR